MERKREVLAFCICILLAAVLYISGLGAEARAPVDTTPLGYMPVVLYPENTPTPTNTPTNTPQPTNTPLPTSTPTPTPTTPPPADVRLTYIMYDPPGSDVDGEYVQIQNFGGTVQNMTSWTLRDVANHVFTFPAFSLGPGASVQVWTKAGTNNASNLYWGSGQAIWNNDGDTAYLRNGGGATIDTCTYAGGGQGANC